MTDSVLMVKMLDDLQKHNKEIEYSKHKDIEELRSLAFDLLNTIAIILEDHKHLQEPFYSVIAKHSHIITKFELFEK